MKAKEVAMIVAISLLAALFIGLLVDAVYSEPQYDEYCDELSERAPKTFPGEGPICDYQASAEDQVLADACHKEKGQAEYDYNPTTCVQTYKDCNYCMKEYNTARELYNRNLFFIIAPIALLCILLGLYWKFEVVGTGFMFSGILLLFYATVRYFEGMGKILRVVIIGIELLLLLWISKKKLKK